MSKIPTVSLHFHERIDPRTIIESVRRRGNGVERQKSLFEFTEENPPLREAIKYGSNFQSFVNKRDVKDGKDEDLTQEPEMIRIFVCKGKIERWQ